jgi:hypothetical protein
MSRTIPDNFLLGLLIGAGTLAATAWLAELARTSWYGDSSIPFLLRAPKPELAGLIACYAWFRFFMTRAGRERTGKGVLASMMLVVVVYYWLRP